MFKEPMCAELYEPWPSRHILPRVQTCDVGSRSAMAPCEMGLVHAYIRVCCLADWHQVIKPLMDNPTH